MSTQKTKSNGGIIVIFMFISGIGLMIISDGIDIIFGVGLLFFLISIIIAIISVTWSIAGSADRALGKFIDGDSK
jgi:hypothetical protein